MASELNLRRLAILAFHKIGAPLRGDRATSWYIPETVFASHLGYLQENGWRVISLGDLLKALAVPESLPSRAVLLTFDDGYRSTLSVAIPWLRRFGYPSGMFVPTQFIGSHNAFDEGYEPREAICDWNDLRELERFGCSIQSHGVSHKRLSWLSPAELEEELFASKATLENGLGKPVEVFAYPYGDEGADPRRTLEAVKRVGYRAACLYGGGPNPVPMDDSLRLMRIPMGCDTDLAMILGQ